MSTTQPDQSRTKPPLLLEAFDWDKIITQTLWPQGYEKETPPSVAFPKNLKHTYKSDYTIKKGEGTTSSIELHPSEGTTITINCSTAGGTVLPERFVAKIVYRFQGGYSMDALLKYRASATETNSEVVAFYSSRLSKGNWHALVSGFTKDISNESILREAVHFITNILAGQSCIDSPSPLDEELLSLACKVGPDSSAWISEKVRRSDIDYPCKSTSEIKMVPCPYCERPIGERPMGITSETCSCLKTKICFNALCNRPIAANDKFCPHCEKKQPGAGMSCLAGLLGLLGIIGIFLFAALMSRGCS
jgi:hypothetical protein